MVVYPQSQTFQSCLEGFCGVLFMETGQYNTGNIQTQFPEDFQQAQNIPVVGDAQVTPDLVLLNVTGIDDNDHFYLIL